MVIGSNLLEAALRDAITKLTEEYLNQIVQFIQDVSINNYENFAQRIEGMKAELSTYTVQEQPERAIGFQHNGEKK